jgi:hypothetical protein
VKCFAAAACSGHVDGSGDSGRLAVFQFERKQTTRGATAPLVNLGTELHADAVRDQVQ